MKSSGGENLVYFIVNLFNIPIFILAYYYLKHILIPHFYEKDKYILFFINFLIGSFGLYLLWRVFGILWLDNLRDLCDIPFMRFDRYLVYTVQFYSPGILLLVWEMIEEKRAEKERFNELEKQKLNTELKYLKAQLNPHFLFNSFNNLHSLIVTNDSKAADMVLQLSSILEFILYKSQKPHVMLQEEVEVVEKYIELEKIRYGDRLKVSFEKEGDFSMPISPLLVLSLVENAFKHGASGDIDNPEIKINLKVEAKQLSCNIWNTKSQYQGELKDVHKEGIGLSNVKRQLSLQYPDQHELIIQDLDEYNVQLKVNHE